MSQSEKLLSIFKKVLDNRKYQFINFAEYLQYKGKKIENIIDVILKDKKEAVKELAK